MAGTQIKEKVSSMGLGAKLIGLMAIILLLVVVALFLSSQMTLNRSLLSDYSVAMERQREAFSHQLESEGLALLSFAGGLASNTGLQYAIDSGNRGTLIQILQPLFQAQRDLQGTNDFISTIEVTDNKGVVLLRAHNLEVHGDDKSKTPAFAKVLQDKKPNIDVNFSTTTSKLTVDAVFPVMEQGRLSGLIKVGVYPAESFLQRLSMIGGVELALVNTNSDAVVGETLPGLVTAAAGRGQKELDRIAVTGRDFFVRTLPLTFRGNAVSGVTLVMATDTVRLDALIGDTVWALVVIAMIALVVGLTLVWIFVRRSLAPLGRTVTMLEDLEHGRLGFRLALKRKDEIGRMAAAMDRFADSLEQEIVAGLQKLAAGDLTFNVVPRGDDDQIRQALKRVNIDLREVLGQVQLAAEQIDAGSGQVSDSAQHLSQGATESAASLEEISSSMNEISSRARQSAEHANQASQLADGATQAARSGSERMTTMVGAMREINEAGQNIRKIIKVIDEIAFQTNLLALNAAVEAARAGQHGKGFAVVAEEVRNLAARSAKAAEETALLIEGSVEKTDNGTQIAQNTADALNEIVTSVGKVTDLIAEISAVGTEQAQGIAEITQGIGQIDQAVQQNTATAEESAAAAEELSSQSAHLRGMLDRFVLAESPARSAAQIRALPAGVRK